MKTWFIVTAVLFGLHLGSQARMVETVTGKKIDVTFIAWNGEIVKVRSKKGRVQIVKLNALVESDRAWVRENVKRDLQMGKNISARPYSLRDGRKVTAELVGIRGMEVELKAGEKSAKLSLLHFAEADQLFIVKHAPHLDALNANPEIRHSPILIANAAKKIDELILKQNKGEGQEPGSVVDDGTFLRRSYLSIIGRVPSVHEAREFHEDSDPAKRDKLIEYLFEHEGYVHRMFNYWADLLRVKSRLPGRNYGAAMYAQWIKDSVRENKPYDSMITEMLTATGFYWDNPAVGYYRRDINMPLDNLAVMCQTLLGASIVCAQCHDHPFDNWTQKEYYEMAAFTYPMVTRKNANNIPNVKEAQKQIRASFGKDKEAAKQFATDTRRLRQTLIDYPLRAGSEESNRRLKFPKTYQYSNAKPNAVVNPAAPFGKEIQLGSLKDKTIAPFVDWFTSPENPRFAKNIANRLWKESFGIGMIEPVDDIKEHSKPFNPELMEFLTELVVDLQFDLKAYQKVLYKTEFFQRESYTGEVNPVEGYPMTGPLLRRLTAEQLWDSVLTLILPDLDKRINHSLLRGDLGVAQQGQLTLKMEPQEIVSKLKGGKGQDYKKIRAMEMEMMEMASMEQMDMSGGEKRKLDQMSKKEKKAYVERKKKERDPWHMFGRDMYRAAELQSPAPGGHFLNIFGQSDRELTENDKQEASIPQALTLMNDIRLLDYMFYKPFCVLPKALEESTTPKDRIETIFLATYSRYPTEKEWDELKLHLRDGKEGTKRILWAVVNSQAYRFMQ